MQLVPVLPAVAGFEEFWAAYPRKTAKKAARNAWEKLKPTPGLAQALVLDCQQRVAQGEWDTGRGKAYIPHPATYLNGERWEDEIIPRAEFKPAQDFSELARQAINLNEGL